MRYFPSLSHLSMVYRRVCAESDTQHLHVIMIDDDDVNIAVTPNNFNE